MVRHNNQLPDNLPQLQNLIKRDAESYKQEFLQQYRHFSSLLDVFNLHPDQYEKKLEELIMFLAQVSHCYPTELATLPQEFINILQSHHTKLNADMRMTLCKALILLRNKNLLAPTDLLSLFFNLLRCQDKNLRIFLQLHIITDIKNVNSKSKNTKLNTTLQNFMYKMLSDSNAKAAKMSLDIMVELYRKNIWNDAKTANVMATALFSKQTKVLVAALKFFATSDEPVEEEKDSDSEDELTPRDVIMANKFNKKSRKRERQLKKVKQLFAKKKKKQAAPVYSFSALHLVHDPQGLAERLFRQLETRHERFEVKLMSLDVISRLIGLHQLIVLNFYPYVQRFIQPHQKEVTKILVFVAQSAHELVPPDVLEPVLKTLVNNFVTERNSSDVISIGLNAVREICSRCPLVMTTDLLHDLSQYKKYRERSVMMAAHSLIHLFRSHQPEMLRRKDRGRPTEATAEVHSREFGEVDSKGYVPGAEVLSKPASSKQAKDSKEDDSDDDWVDIPDDGSNIDISDSDESDAEDDDDEDNGSDAEEEEGDDDEVEEEDDDEEEEEEEEENKVANKKKGKISTSTDKSQDGEKPKSKEDIAMEISMARILTDEDFKRIDAAQLRKQMQGISKGKKRAAEEDAIREKGELVSLGDIENIYKKRRHDKEARVETVRKGQEGREKFGYKVNRQNPHASTTNREKSKKKNFMMVRHKARGKIKRSFKDKQLALKNHLMKQKKMK